MKIQHEGKQYEVEQDRVCNECSMSFYILIFDLTLERGNEFAGYTDCPHCHNEQVVYLHKVGETKL